MFPIHKITKGETIYFIENPFYTKLEATYVKEKYRKIIFHSLITDLKKLLSEDKVNFSFFF